MVNCSKYVSDKTGSVVFVRKNNQIICSETWEDAYRLIFRTKATVEYIDLDNEYSTTRVDAKADAANFVITLFVPAEYGKDSKRLEITYSLTEGISEREVPSELSEEIAELKKNGTDGAGEDVAVRELIEVVPKTSKNLVNVRYDAKTVSGVTFTPNDDGTISLSGTSTEGVWYTAGAAANIPYRFPLAAGTYILSGAPNIDVYQTAIVYTTRDGSTIVGEYHDQGKGKVFTVTEDCWVYVRPYIVANKNVDGLVYRTQVEAGDQKTEYVSPFVDGVRSKRLDEIEQNVETLMTQTGLEVPAYYHNGSYLDNKVSRINELARSVGADGDAFVFITDTHWEKNARKSPALLKYLHEKTHIDMLFGGGDYMDNAYSEVPPLFECVDALRYAWAGPRYLTLGNHDYMGSEAYILTDKDLYYAVNSYGVERVGNLNRNYYYVDNQQTKLRYIVLNRYIDRVPITTEINGLNEEQRAWLETVALDVEDGWSVLVFVHDLYRFVFDNGDDTADVTLLYNDSKAVVTILDDFKAGGGTVVGIFCGEAHNDRVNYTPGGIPVITTTCDKNKSGGEGTPISYQWAERLDGTIHEQAFDVMIVDKTNRTIHAVRIGYPARDSLEGAWGEKVDERTITY